MSAVTDVIVLANLNAYGPHEDAVNTWLDEHADGQRLLGIDERGHGRCKCFESDCAAAAFNHFDVDAFTAFLRTLPWAADSDVQVCYRGPGDERFRLVDLHRSDAR